jgi:hypothetical protein
VIAGDEPLLQQVDRKVLHLIVQDSIRADHRMTVQPGHDGPVLQVVARAADKPAGQGSDGAADLIGRILDPPRGMHHDANVVVP